MNLPEQNLLPLSWPLSRLGEAIAMLAQEGHLVGSVSEVPNLPVHLGMENPAGLARWVEAAAEWLEIEAEPVEILYRHAEATASRMGPAIVRLMASDGQHFIAVLKSVRGQVHVLAPNLLVHRVDLEHFCSEICSGVEGKVSREVEQMLQIVETSAWRRKRARKAILDERLGAWVVTDGWILRQSPGGNLWKQVQQAQLPSIFLLYLGVYIPKIIVALLAWWFLWKGALQSVPDWGWLAGWVLMELTILPFRLLEPWYAGLFAIGLGWLLKRRLLSGALRLEPDEPRNQGAGHFLGRVLEAESAETLILDGGMLFLSHTIDMLLILPVMIAGAGGWLQAGVLGLWLLFAAGLSWRYLHLRRLWTDERLDITHDLVEKMVGHQTRLAQELPDRWHAGEDLALENYLRLSKKMDRMTVFIKTVIPRGWLILGLLLLLPAFLAGEAALASLGVGLGATLFAYQSIELLSFGMITLAEARVSWEKIADLFWAADRAKVKGDTALAIIAPQTETVKPAAIIDAQNLLYRYRGRGEAVLKNCTLHIASGDRVLLQGPSGGGKSTLAAMIFGLRQPEAGLFLLDGFDRHTLGDGGWGQRVAAAPQFHENHVFIGTFAYNLLMGRGWPPREGDVEAAQEICEELGLSELLQSMPAGMLQMVGEVGWQLSHGERSRLYIARSLLQGAPLVLLDESFAALDPQTLRRTMDCVLRRAKTLVVIAHP